MKRTCSPLAALLLAIVASSWNPRDFLGGLLVAASDEEQSCVAEGTCAAPDEDSSDDDSEDDSGDDSEDDGRAKGTRIPRPAPLDSSDDSEDDSEDSSDDEEMRTGNRYAHRDPDEDPEDSKATCNEYLDLRGYVNFPETSSFYQEIGWSEHRDTADVCMTLDDIVQICDDYRPHYHEPFVHFPAAYLKEFKRVAFIGGGDAMLLHEAMKYPGVELILGLELDQKNVRESLRHFRVRPHFDEYPKVQWWFGDAAKSLNLLPREWFGTFDLVMVDLSETGMSISVNNDLDIFGAMALLLKPEGILVKNENYFGQMSKYFDYTISVYMDQYPKLCDQDWAMGSNGIDFLSPKLTGGHVEKNKVKTLAYLPLSDEDEHYKMIIDYSHNDAKKLGLCDDRDEEVAEKKEPVKPTRSSGILLVVDADNATKSLDLASFKSALGASAMTPIDQSFISLPSSDDATKPSSLFIGMEEGYVVAHTYPEKPSSVGLEILLWSKLGTQNDVLRSLLDAVGVDDDSYSSYRVIHGGMNGHKGWEEEVDALGPELKNTRDCDPSVKSVDYEGNAVAAEQYGAVVAEGLSLLAKKSDKTVAVLCGVRGVNDCPMVEALKKVRRVGQVVAIWTCPEGKSRAATEEEEEDDGGTSVSHVYACGEGTIRDSADAAEGYGALVVDPGAPPDVVRMGQQVFCSDRILRMEAHPYLRDRATFFTPLANDAHDLIFKRCLRRISKKLIRTGIVVLDKSAAVGVVVAANDSFPRRLVTVAANVEKKLGVTTEIDKIKSGPVPFQDRFRPDYATQAPYDPKGAMRQYVGQAPLASQSVYQIEVADDDEARGLSRTLAREVLDSIVAKSPLFAGAERSYFEAGDGSVSVAAAPGRRVVVAWNGAGIFTINTLTDTEDYRPVSNDKDGHEMLLVDHAAEVVDVFGSRLPASAAVVAREQMPRGANRVVNFKTDMSGVEGCADYYQMCGDFARDGDCDRKEDKRWMRENCAVSCGTCDKMRKSLQ